MIINGITISENKYKELSSILPKEVLNDLYTCKGYSNTEISKMFCVS